MRWRQAYRRVNDRYSRATAAVAAPGATAWIHDLQLQLVPAMLRRLRPDLQIGFFLHAPFPPVELFEKLPQRREILGGLLGADLVGFQSQRSAANFCQAVTEFGDYRMDSGLVHPDGRRIAVGTFPLSVDTADLERRARDPLTRRRATQIRTELSLPRAVLLAVDRLEPAEGVEERLVAYQELLAEGRVDPASTVLVQIALPSRRHRPDRPDTWTRIERKVAEINGLHSQLTRPAVHFLHQPLEPQELVAFYLAADVMLATPLRSGMSLRAKEYLACHTDGVGTLVLSEGSGAAAAFPEALTVNPHDLDALKFAILTAIEPAHPDIHRNRLRAMRRRLREHDVHRWATSYLDALGETMTLSMRPRTTVSLPMPLPPRTTPQMR
jgi:trehalose 6-phosphate synthase